MKAFFKYVVPFFLLIPFVLLLVSPTYWQLGNMILIFIVPISIIYIVSVFYKELDKRHRNDRGVDRALVYSMSLFSILTLLYYMISIFFHLGDYRVNLIVLFAGTFLSIGICAFYVFRNFRKFDYYIPYEFLIAILPALFVIGYFYKSSNIQLNDYNKISKNAGFLETQNLYFIENYDFDSVTLKSYYAIEQVKDKLIERSGGIDQFGNIVFGKNKEYVSLILFIFNDVDGTGIDKIKRALKDINMNPDEFEWLRHEEMIDVMVNDAVLKMEILKYRVLIEGMKNQDGYKDL